MKKRRFGSFKTIVALALCVLMSFSMFACNQAPDNSNTTVINIITADNAYGVDLLEAQAARFSALHAEDSYAPGKKGVKVEISTTGTSINIDESLLSEGYHILGTGDGYTKAFTAASNGWIANINDILTTEIEADGKSIVDKIPEFMRWNYYLDADDGATYPSGYYALPTNESYGGLTYDKDIFDEGYYFAADGATDVISFDSEILEETYNFTANYEERTVGPDGLPNTEDDGLPSSLYELIALCENLDNEGIPPFLITATPAFYVNYFVEALYVSLLGYENGKALKDFKSDGVDVVVGYTDEDLFPGALDGVKKPITQRVTIDEKYGYYMSHTVEKYYAFAFMQMIEEREWYKTSSDAKTTQLDFLLGYHQQDRRGAMLIECSYWVNESRIRKNFDNYDIVDRSKPASSRNPNRGYRWMSLPVNIMTSVDGTNESVNTGINTESKAGEPITLYIPDGGYLCVNARYQNNEEIMGAIKDYFLFRYSDAELSWYTANANYGCMLDYDIKDSDLTSASDYTKSFAKLLKTANKVYPYGNSTVYKNNYSKLGKQGGSASYLFGGGALGTINVRQYLKDNSKYGNAVLLCFEDKIIYMNHVTGKSNSNWIEYFGANGGEVPEAQYYPQGHPKEGQQIQYEGLDYSN